MHQHAHIHTHPHTQVYALTHTHTHAHVHSHACFQQTSDLPHCFVILFYPPLWSWQKPIDFVAVQLSSKPPFSFDVVYKPVSGPAVSLAQPPLSEEAFTAAMAEKKEEFDRKFENAFLLEAKVNFSSCLGWCSSYRFSVIAALICIWSFLYYHFNK